jgi:hypothetical protein
MIGGHSWRERNRGLLVSVSVAGVLLFLGGCSSSGGTGSPGTGGTGAIGGGSGSSTAGGGQGGSGTGGTVGDGGGGVGGGGGRNAGTGGSHAGGAGGSTGAAGTTGAGGSDTGGVGGSGAASWGCDENIACACDTTGAHLGGACTGTYSCCLMTTEQGFGMCTCNNVLSASACAQAPGTVVAHCPP